MAFSKHFNGDALEQNTFSILSERWNGGRIKFISYPIGTVQIIDFMLKEQNVVGEVWWLCEVILWHALLGSVLSSWSRIFNGIGFTVINTGHQFGVCTKDEQL